MRCFLLIKAETLILWRQAIIDLIWGIRAATRNTSIIIYTDISTKVSPRKDHGAKVAPASRGRGWRIKAGADHIAAVSTDRGERSNMCRLLIRKTLENSSSISTKS